MERATLVTSDSRRTALELAREDTVHTVTVDSLGVYSIVVFHEGELA
jgi:hypothetical protein